MPRDYWWYDSEDGQDVWKKVNFAAKVSTIASLPIWSYKFCLLNFPKTVPQMGVGALAVVGPIVGMGTIFAYTSQMLCRELPQLDPKLSYAIGGAAAGSVIGAVARNPVAGCMGAFYLGLFAPVIRYAHERGWEHPFSYNFPMARGDSAWDDMNYSMLKRQYLPPPMSTPVIN